MSGLGIEEKDDCDRRTIIKSQKHSLHLLLCMQERLSSHVSRLYSHITSLLATMCGPHHHTNAQRER